MTNKTGEAKEVPIGARLSFRKTVSESDVYTYAGVTGDFSPNHVGEHDLLWGIHAATAWAALSALSLASPGYHRSKRGRNVPSSVRVRVCSSRCAPRFVHCIC